jgi:PilZ domain
MNWTHLLPPEEQELLMPVTPSAPISVNTPPSYLSSLRREERLETALPARLIFPRVNTADETIPSILLDLSASGCQLLTDQRFSLLLPPTSATRLVIEFFFDELEIHQVPIQVAWSRKVGNYQLFLGCKFVDLPTAARLALRSEIAKRNSGSGW